MHAKSAAPGKLTRTWGNSPRSDWTPPRGSERFYSCEMFMIESRNEKKEDGLRSPLTESRRGAEPKVWTPLPHVCAGVALDLTGDTIMELAAPRGAPLSRARSGSVDHRGAEPKVRTPLPHDCAGVALGMELAAPCGARRSARNEKKMEASTWSSTFGTREWRRRRAS